MFSMCMRERWLLSWIYLIHFVCNNLNVNDCSSNCIFCICCLHIQLELHFIWQFIDIYTIVHIYITDIPNLYSIIYKYKHACVLCKVIVCKPNEQKYRYLHITNIDMLFSIFLSEILILCWFWYLGSIFLWNSRNTEKKLQYKYRKFSISVPQGVPVRCIPKCSRMSKCLQRSSQFKVILNACWKCWMSQTNTRTWWC